MTDGILYNLVRCVAQQHAGLSKVPVIVEGGVAVIGIHGDGAVCDQGKQDNSRQGTKATGEKSSLSRSSGACGGGESEGKKDGCDTPQNPLARMGTRAVLAVSIQGSLRRAIAPTIVTSTLPSPNILLPRSILGLPHLSHLCKRQMSMVSLH